MHINKCVFDYYKLAFKNLFSVNFMYKNRFYSMLIQWNNKYKHTKDHSKKTLNYLINNIKVLILSFLKLLKPP